MAVYTVSFTRTSATCLPFFVYTFKRATRWLCLGAVAAPPDAPGATVVAVVPPPVGELGFASGVNGFLPWNWSNVPGAKGADGGSKVVVVTRGRTSGGGAAVPPPPPPRRLGSTRNNTSRRSTAPPAAMTARR